MTLHYHELPRLGADKTMAGLRPDVTDRWQVRRSEVVLPSLYSVGGVLVMGLFALSLAGAGIGYQLTRIWRRG